MPSIEPPDKDTRMELIARLRKASGMTDIEHDAVIAEAIAALSEGAEARELEIREQVRRAYEADRVALQAKVNEAEDMIDECVSLMDAHKVPVRERLRASGNAMKRGEYARNLADALREVVYLWSDSYLPDAPKSKAALDVAHALLQREGAGLAVNTEGCSNFLPGADPGRCLCGRRVEDMGACPAKDKT